MYVPNDTGLGAVPRVVQDVRDCARFPVGPERDACMIGKGYRKTGPGSYSRSTGVPIGKVAAAVAVLALPVVAGAVAGTVVGSVTRAVPPSVTKAVEQVIQAANAPDAPAAMVTTPTVSVPAVSAPAAVAAVSRAPIPWVPIAIAAGLLLVVAPLLRGKG